MIEPTWLYDAVASAVVLMLPVRAGTLATSSRLVCLFGPEKQTENKEIEKNERQKED